MQAKPMDWAEMPYFLAVAREGSLRLAAESLGVRWIEFFMQGVALNDELLQEDRIHPNVAAQPILLDNAWPIIRATLDAK